MYQCIACKEFSESQVPSLTQSFDTDEELRCKNCYSQRSEERFNAQKSLKALNENLSALILKLKTMDRQDFKYEDVYKKVKETERRIDKAIEFLKEVNK